MPLEAYSRELDRVTGLRELTMKRMKIGDTDKNEIAPAMEFVLDGLHQFSRIAKDEIDHVTSYKDMVGSIFTGREREDY